MSCSVRRQLYKPSFVISKRRTPSKDLPCLMLPSTCKARSLFPTREAQKVRVLPVLQPLPQLNRRPRPWSGTSQRMRKIHYTTLIANSTLQTSYRSMRLENLVATGHRRLCTTLPRAMRRTLPHVSPRLILRVSAIPLSPRLHCKGSLSTGLL